MKTVENVTKRKPRRDSIPRLWNAKGMFPGYLVGSHVLFCDVLRVMFAYLRVSCEYKFQLNWILMKQSSVLPTQKPRVIRDIQVESVLNIHVCISMRNRLLYKPPPSPTHTPSTCSVFKPVSIPISNATRPEKCWQCQLRPFVILCFDKHQHGSMSRRVKNVSEATNRHTNVCEFEAQGEGT